MKKILIVVLAICMSTAYVFAEGVNVKRANQLANSFMAHKSGRQAIDLSLSAKSDVDAWYLFSDANAWVIVAGETDLYPVLAFSDQAGLDATVIPPAMLSYLQAREAQVSAIRNNRTIHPENRAAWRAFECKGFYSSRESIEPLLNTKWNQGWPYNMFCPAHVNGPGGHVYAGCVATAMSQIMKYHNYPETGRLSHSYFWGEDVEIDFSEGNYDWDAMSASANTSSQEAIAKLMFHCGVAVDMDYSPDGSGSNVQVAAYAMKQYFKYKSGLEFVDEVNYSDAEWKFLLKEDLDKSHPILYRGTSDSGGGHAFVCDAYQDTSYFHFNFGWSGYGDGFFNLDDQDFHWGQGAVINIMPYWGNYCNSMVYTQESWSFDDGSGPNYYWNETDCEWLIQPEGAEKVVLNFEAFNTEAGDILFVYDGSSVDDPLIGEFSGSNIPSELISSGGALLLRFVTDADGQTTGWKVNYESVVAGVDIENVSFELYPNPAKDIINLELLSEEESVVEILDVMGKVVKTEMLTGAKNCIDVSSISEGLYVIKIQQSEKLMQQSFLIK